MLTIGDKADVEKTVSELLSVTGASTYLSSGVNGGAAIINEYASGGFDVLYERLDKPRRLETFLRAFAKLIAELDAERKAVEADFENDS